MAQRRTNPPARASRPLGGPAMRSPALTDGQSMRSEEYGLQMSVLNERRRVDGIRTECQNDPKTWDSIDMEYTYQGGKLYGRRVDFDREVARVSQAMALCSYCPLLAECQPLAELALTTDPESGTVYMDASGTIGGVFVDNTLTGKAVVAFIETGQLPGNVRLG